MSTRNQESTPHSGGKTGQTERAYAILKEEIMQNRMPLGLQPPEPEIARRMNMSRTPVREALVRLSSEGLVSLEPRRGPRVLPMSPNDMREIYQLLTALESELAADIAQTGLPEDVIAELTAATDDMEKFLRQDDLTGWSKADDIFHRTLLKQCKNKRMTDFIGSLLDQSHRARMITLRMRKAPRHSTREHHAILKAITDKDEKRARALYGAHRKRASNELLGILEKVQLSQL